MVVCVQRGYCVTSTTTTSRFFLSRYVIGSVISWPIYAALIAVFYGKFGMPYLATATSSWVASYMVVYVALKLDAFRRDKTIFLEMLLYTEYVTAISGLINFGLLHVFETYTSVSRLPAITFAAVVAAGTGFTMSRIVLDPIVFNWLMQKRAVRFVAAAILGIGINFALLYVLVKLAS